MSLSAHTDNFTAKLASTAPYMWNAVIIADILDKQGRLMIEGIEQQQELKPLGTGNNSERLGGDDGLMSKVKRQMDGCERLHEAVTVYRHLYHATEVQLGPYSLEHCWVANRLGGILEIFGLREEALELYEKARDGRMKKLPSHKATLESTERAILLQSSLRQL